jgi:sensor histidine kinase YesM
MLLSMTLLLLLLLTTSFLFYKKSRQDFEEKKVYDINICVKSIKEHLNNTELQLVELMLNTLDESNLNSPKDMLKIIAKGRISALIKNKLSVNSDVDCFFVKKTKGLLLKSYGASTPSASRHHIMSYLWKNEKPDAYPGLSSRWKIIKIKDEAFFYLAYEMEGYIVGTFVRVAIFDRELSVILDQDLDSYGYIENNQFLYDQGTNYKDINDTDGEQRWNRLINGRIAFQNTIPDTDIIFAGIFRMEILKLVLNNTYIMFAGIVLIFMVMLNVLHRKISRFIINPIYHLLNGMLHVADGDFEHQLDEDVGSNEFNVLNQSFNRMVNEIVDLRIQKYEQQIKDSERRMKLLRLQIKPHFYLNAITTIRSMTYQDRNEDIRTYLDVLSGHIRYMLRINSSEVLLTEELTHIENYLKLQEIKFPKSVAYYIGCSPELQEKKIGHLLLYTIIENSFKFAMNLYDTLILLIQCELHKDSTFQGYRVIIEDNGGGFSKEQLEKFQIDIEVEEKQEGQHIGLSNIRKTLELQYGRRDLLRLSNVEPHGARVEIWIPDTEDMTPEGGMR